MTRCRLARRSAARLPGTAATGPLPRLSSVRYAKYDFGRGGRRTCLEGRAELSIVHKSPETAGCLRILFSLRASYRAVFFPVEHSTSL